MTRILLVTCGNTFHVRGRSAISSIGQMSSPAGGPGCLTGGLGIVPMRTGAPLHPDKQTLHENAKLYDIWAYKNLGLMGVQFPLRLRG